MTLERLRTTLAALNLTAIDARLEAHLCFTSRNLCSTNRPEL